MPTKRLLLWSAVCVVAIAGLAFGGWWLASRGDEFAIISRLFAGEDRPYPLRRGQIRAGNLVIIGEGRKGKSL